MQELYPSTEFYHSGVKGMKWGVRRYQNKDGTLNRRGARKAAKMKKKYTAMTGKQLRKIPSKTVDHTPRKSISEMTDAELQKAINRRRMEKDYAELLPKKNKVNVGKKVAGAMFDKIIVPVAIDAGKNAANKMLGIPVQENKSKDKKKVRVYT